MTFSLNNRLIVEEYVKDGLKPKMQGMIATPGQKDGVKGLKVLIGTRLSDGKDVPAGSIAYIREDILYNNPNFAKSFSCATLSCRFMIADVSLVEFIDTNEPGSAA